MNKYIDESEDEELDQFQTSPIMNELAKQQAPITDIPNQNQMLEEEMSAADEIANESADLASNYQDLVPSPTMQKKAEYEDMLAKITKLRPAATSQDELKNLQKQSLDNSKMLNYFRIGDKLATAYGNRYGGKGQGFQEIYDNLEKQGQQPIQDYTQLQKDEATQMELGNEREMNDPNSDISKFYQSRVTALGTKLGMNPEEIQKLKNMTAKQLSKIPGFSESLRNSQPQLRFERVLGPDGIVKTIAIDTRTGETVREVGTSGYAPQYRTDKRTNEILNIAANSTMAPRLITGPKDEALQEIDKEGKSVPKKEFNEFDLQNSLDTKKYENFQKVREQFSSEVKEDKAAAAKVDGVIQLIDEAQKNPAASGMAGAAVARLIEKGVLTDQDVIRYAQRNGILNQLQDKLNKFVTGEFSPELARDISSSIKTYQKGAQDSINKRALTYAKQFKGAIDPKNPIKDTDIAKMIYADYSTPMSKDKQSKEKTVVKKGYNSKTNKTQLIYSDGTKEVVDGRQ